jgi:proline dehydrogenase
MVLALSESPWLRLHAPRWRIVRKAATRFMPGETFEDAFAAAHTLRQQGLGTVLTQLGENVTDAAKADDVVRHYSDVLARIERAR